MPVGLGFLEGTNHSPSEGKGVYATSFLAPHTKALQSWGGGRRGRRLRIQFICFLLSFSFTVGCYGGVG